MYPLCQPSSFIILNGFTDNFIRPSGGVPRSVRGGGQIILLPPLIRKLLTTEQNTVHSFRVLYDSNCRDNERTLTNGYYYFENRFYQSVQQQYMQQTGM